MMAILASVRLSGSDRERRLGRFETAASAADAGLEAGRL